MRTPHKPAALSPVAASAGKPPTICSTILSWMPPAPAESKPRSPVSTAAQGHPRCAPRVALRCGVGEGHCPLHDTFVDSFLRHKLPDGPTITSTLCFPMTSGNSCTRCESASRAQAFLVDNKYDAIPSKTLDKRNEKSLHDPDEIA